MDDRDVILEKILNEAEKTESMSQKFAFMSAGIGFTSVSLSVFSPVLASASAALAGSFGFFSHLALKKSIEETNKKLESLQSFGDSDSVLSEPAEDEKTADELLAELRREKQKEELEKLREPNNTVISEIFMSTGNGEPEEERKERVL